MEEKNTDRHYFLTGPTGVVGSALLQRLAKRNERATLLIRGRSRTEVDQRLEKLLDFYGISPAAAAKIDAIPGDLYAPQLGLEQADYDRIAAECTHIVHCAGNVHMNLPMEEARRQTLAMTKGILTLMAACVQVRKMEFVSTVGVGGHTPGEIPETWITHRRTFRNSYEAAKSEAEEEVRRAIESGLPITVHRPSMVVGDSQDGRNIAFQVFYYLCEFLCGARTLGFIPRPGGLKLDIIPADYVARVLDWSSRKESNTLPTPILHLCSGPRMAIDLDELIRSARTIFKKNGRRLPRIKKVPVSILKLMLNIARPWIPPKQRRAVDALPFFFAYLKEKQTFGNTRTRELLEADGITLPGPQEYLEPVLTYYLKETAKRTKK